MKDDCCSNMKSICEQLDCKVRETEKGIQIGVNAKDKSKTESLKNLFKACGNFFGCCK